MTRPVGKIRDVAKATGLSIATVSRVMNGGKNVSPNTRDQTQLRPIMEMIAEVVIPAVQS